MTTWRVFVAALAIPVLFTVLVLIHVQRNRTGARAPIELTEREVTLSTGSDENSGMTAWIVWAADSDPGPRWVSADTLRALGFDLTPGAPAAPPGRRQLLRRAYIALELRPGQQTRSRLVPVDASMDRDALAARYPNGATHVITAGTIGIQETRSLQGTSSLEGVLVSIEPRGIHVPAEFAERLRRASARDRRFTLSVRYGAQLEPWIVDQR